MHPDFKASLPHILRRQVPHLFPESRRTGIYGAAAESDEGQIRQEFTGYGKPCVGNDFDSAFDGSQRAIIRPRRLL